MCNYFFMKIIKIKIMKLRHLMQFRRYNFTFIRMIVNMSNTYYSMVDILYDNNSSICCLKLIRLDAPKDSSSFQYLSRVWDHQNCCTSSFILLIRWYGMQNKTCNMTKNHMLCFERRSEDAFSHFNLVWLERLSELDACI